MSRRRRPRDGRRRGDAGYIDCHGRRAHGLSTPAIFGRVMQTQNCLVAAPEMAKGGVPIAAGVKVGHGGEGRAGGGDRGGI